MSTLCCAVVVGGGDALSPMRIRVPAAAEPDLSGDDEAATTPEASTDSENDSSFESDEDGSSEAGRKSPPRRPGRGWAGCSSNSGKGALQLQQRAQPPQPLRKVRFTLHDNDQHNRRVSGAMYRKGWGKGRRAALRDSVLADVGMMRPADLAQQQGARPCFSNASATQRISNNKAITTTSSSSSKSATSTNDSGRRAWKKRTIAAAPFKSTSANIGGTVTSARATNASPAAASASPPQGPLPFRGAAFSALPPTPASPKKRKVSALLSSSSPRSRSSSRARGDGSSSSRPTRGAAAVAAVVQGAAATASELKAAATTAKRMPAAAAAAAAAGPMDLSCGEDGDEAEELDLTCREELDLSCEGEIRTPICRFLLPCWPEGVEGYEEAGGWRRLGGSYTRENFPRGRRSI